MKGQTSLKPQDKHVEFGAPPTTRVVRGGAPKVENDAPRTQLVRGKVQVKRGEFEQDPVVGWLVIVGGAGMGSYRPIFEGNNTVGRAATQRIPLDFGDDSISSEEQAYIRYDSAARSFLFVPNLAKTNVVSINDKRPTGAVELHQMDVITIGRTQLVFVPFCGVGVRLGRAERCQGLMQAFDHASRATKGARDYQEDSSAFWPPKDRTAGSADVPPTAGASRLVAVLADGMGGHTAGALASRMVCDSFISAYAGLNGSRPERLIKALDLRQRFHRRAGAG